MRLLLVVDQLASGGTEWQLVYTLPELRRHLDRIDLVVLFPTPKGGSGVPLATTLEANDIRVHDLDLPRRWDLVRNANRVRKMINRLRPDVVHARHYFSGILTAATHLTNPRVRRVVSFHNLAYEFETNWKGQGRKLIDRVALNAAIDRFAAVSTKTAESYRRHLGLDQVEVVPNAVPADHIIALDDQDHAEVKARYGLAPDEPFILMPARQVAVKGHRYLLEALASLDETPRTLMGGRGPEATNTRNTIDRLGLQDRVILHAEDIPHDDILALMSVAEIVVLASTHEGFPNAAAEAMAAATPFVGTAVGGLFDLVEDGVSGVLVEPKNPSALAGAIRRVLDDRPFAASLAAAGRQRVVEKFSVEQVVSRWLALYARATS